MTSEIESRGRQPRTIERCLDRNASRQQDWTNGSGGYYYTHRLSESGALCGLECLGAAIRVPGCYDQVPAPGFHVCPATVPLIGGSAKAMTAVTTSLSCAGSRSSRRCLRRQAAHRCCPIAP
jgi:hypothetical protein